MTFDSVSGKNIEKNRLQIDLHFNEWIGKSIIIHGNQIRASFDLNDERTPLCIVAEGNEN